MLDPLLVTTSGMKVVPQLTICYYLPLILRGHGVILIALIAKEPVPDMYYLKPAEILSSSHRTFSPPPSVATQKSFKQSDITDLAHRTLLPAEEINMWIKHLETVTENRKRGAKRAAAMRKGQQQCGKGSSS